MPSSTSSSNSPAAAQRLNIVLFAVTFVVLCAVTIAVRTIVSVEIIALAGEVDEARDYYLAKRGFGGVFLDHQVLFHGKQGTAQHMKSADVLFIGSSRVNFALQDAARERMPRLGLKHYMLGFAHTEADLFPLTIIRKHDLRPKYVVVHAEHNFFQSSFTPYSKGVVRSTVFDYRKTMFEERGANVIQHALHSVLPHWSSFALMPFELELYRSKSDGAWTLPKSYPWSIPHVDPGEMFDGQPHPGRLWDGQKAAAMRFKEEMDKRGVKIIVTYVPYDWGHRRWAELFAKQMDAPLVAPVVDGLDTFDCSHLTPRSASRWADAFFTELERILPKD